MGTSFLLRYCFDSSTEDDMNMWEFMYCLGPQGFCGLGFVFFLRCDYTVGVLMQNEQCSLTLIYIVGSDFLPLTSGAKL